MPQFDDSKSDARLEELRLKEEEELIKMLSKKYGHRYVNLNDVPIEIDALRIINETDAREHEIAPFQKQYKHLGVAIRNPNNSKTQTMLTQLADKGYEVEVFMASHASLEKAWERYEDLQSATASQKGVLDIDAEEIARFAETIHHKEDVATRVQEVITKDTPRTVTEVLEAILGGALSLHASDVHIEPEESQIRIRFRLDGVLFDVLDIKEGLYKLLRSRLKLLAGLKLNVTDEAQDGRFTIDVGEKNLEIRSSIIPGNYGESIVMRILDPSSIALGLEDLGINETLLSVIKEEISRPNGMIITTGPTGSGKTTSLYAFLRTIHKPEVKIITLEDPVEYHVEGIVQTQIEEDYSFAGGLRAILRQDPDVIMVGEIRDGEVAETAVNAALTGHLVFSTLHTNDAVGSFPRLIDLGVDKNTIGSAVNLALAQRLVRRLCEACKEAYTPSEEEATRIAPFLPEGADATTLTLYKATGCEKCNESGYKGRVGVYEGIRMDDALGKIIAEGGTERDILAAARAQNIPTLQEDGVQKLVDGVTSLAELTRVIDLSR